MSDPKMLKMHGKPCNRKYLSDHQGRCNHPEGRYVECVTALRRGKCPEADLDILQEFAENQIKEYGNAESYSRNGESTDFAYGEFEGRVDFAKEVIEKIKEIRERRMG